MKAFIGVTFRFQQVWPLLFVWQLISIISDAIQICAFGTNRQILYFTLLSISHLLTGTVIHTFISPVLLWTMSFLCRILLHPKHLFAQNFHNIPSVFYILCRSHLNCNFCISGVLHLKGLAFFQNIQTVLHSWQILAYLLNSPVSS